MFIYCCCFVTSIHRVYFESLIACIDFIELHRLKMFDNSDYVVEDYIKPVKTRKRLINDERADILGNFDDDDGDNTKNKRKRDKAKEKVVESEENPFADADSDSDDNGDVDDHSEEDEADANEDGNAELDETNETNETSEAEEQPQQEQKKKKKKKPDRTIDSSASTSAVQKDLTEDQVKTLMRGISKKDHLVLYVTNLNYETAKPTLENFFSTAGAVKSVRIPKTRRSAFAFVEMCDLSGYKNALTLHNRKLDGRAIKIQVSEGGKKKSANKKNILKQKNRKLAELRNEPKQFNRSGKGYDKTIKKEIHQRKMQMNRRLAKKQNKK